MATDIFYGPLIARRRVRSLQYQKHRSNDRPTHRRGRLRDWRRKQGMQTDRWSKG